MIEGFFRVVFGLVGCAIIGATAYVTVTANGGFASPQAPLTIAVACGVAVASIAFGVAIARRKWGFVFAFAVVLLAGETAGMLATGERVLANRDSVVEPIRLAKIKRDQAESRLIDAKKVHITTTQRLDAAMKAKDLADAAVASEASKKTCVSNCRALLNKAIEDASAEVRAARAELEEQQRAAANEVQSAKTALDALPPPKSETLLADKLNMQGATLDLILAALWSLGANGLGATLLAWAVHSGHHDERRPSKQAVRTLDAVASQITIEAEIIKAPPVTAKRAQQKRLPSPADLEAARFGREWFAIDDKLSLPVRELFTTYAKWAAQRGEKPMSAKDMATGFLSVFDRLGVTVKNGQAIGVGFKAENERAA